VQLLVLLSRVAAPDGQNTFHLGIEQAFAQNALADHTRRAEKNHLQVMTGS
jgi:hypothetical protein